MRLYRKSRHYKHYWRPDGRPIKIYVDNSVTKKEKLIETKKTKKELYKERYYKYLQSKEWSKIRNEKLNRENGTKKRCAFCGSRNYLQVHHLVYPANIKKTKQSMIRVVCKDCHELIHKMIKDGIIKFNDKIPKNRFKITQDMLLNKHGIYFNYNIKQEERIKFDEETENRFNYVINK